MKPRQCKKVAGKVFSCAPNFFIKAEHCIEVHCIKCNLCLVQMNVMEVEQSVGLLDILFHTDQIHRAMM